jgi:hypothetical protein
MLKTARIASLAAATLLPSPASAGPLAQAEPIGDQRIIREIVVDGAVIEAGSEEAPTNELRPSWVDQGSALDPRHQHSW